MQTSSRYGERLLNSFRLPTAPGLVIRSMKKTEIAITDCRSDHPDCEISTPFPEDDAYIIGLQLRDYAACESWENGRIVAHTNIHAGETHLYDMKRDPRFLMDKPFHMLGFYIPRAAFDSVAEESHTTKIGELTYRPGEGHVDEIVRNLGSSMLAALSTPEQASRLFIEHVTIALAAHVAQTYGGLKHIGARPKGGLAGWQQRRACEMLDANLDGEVSLHDVAAECGLSTGHFTRAFRQSTGKTPHNWLIRRRLEVVKDLLRRGQLPLSEIAVTAGFADQSHLTRIFSKVVGVTPGAWRRCLDLPVDNAHE